MARRGVLLFGSVHAAYVAWRRLLLYGSRRTFTGRYVGPVGALVMSGDIEPGDHARLLARIADDPQRFLSQDKLIVASECRRCDRSDESREASSRRYTPRSASVRSPAAASMGAFSFTLPPTSAAPTAPGLIGISGTQAPDAVGVGDFLRENEVPADLVQRVLRPKRGDVYWLKRHQTRRLSARDHPLSPATWWLIATGATT
jgi:hypothetical protein